MILGPQENIGNVGFELKTSLINMVQASPFRGLPHGDANAHLQCFLNLSATIVIKDVPQDTIRLRLFLFSLLGKVQQWFCKGREAVDTWPKCASAFFAKFFPLGKTNALRGKISSFQ